MSTAVSRYCRTALSVLLFCCGASFPTSSTYAVDTRLEHDEIDPHVYAYTAGFAREFGMPVAWVSDELDGVDAVAYRVMPKYKSCGWRGKLDVCFTHETRCEIDLYFDQRRNPLHWDERHPTYEASMQGYSSYFISSSFVDRSPVRAKEHFIFRKSPLLDSEYGKGVTWRYRFDTKKMGRGSGYTLLTGYERNVFNGMDRMTLNLGCFVGLNHLDLVSEEFLSSRGRVKFGIKKTIYFPHSWNLRKELADEEKEMLLNKFFVDGVRKIMKKLR